MMRTAGFILVLAATLLGACAPQTLFGRGRRGIAWGPGSFDSIGEQLYFTGINAEGERIRYSGGPSNGMMMDGYLSCASCHGPDARGGRHVMHMEVMDAPEIRWSALAGDEHAGEVQEDNGHDDEHSIEYDLETFRRAVVEGEHPDGESLSSDMPRWRMDQESLEALRDYLISLE